MPFQIKYAAALELDAVSADTTHELTAASGRLIRMKLRFPKTLGPEWSQGTVGSTGHRILRNPFRRRKIPTHEVVPAISRCRDNDPGAIETRNGGNIGCQIANPLGILESHEVVEGIDNNLNRRSRRP